ncbi:MAG: EF-hand domain-containing protein [Planctomycetaceae bacterium]|nr:EF-hand domain-containing protein [Planctomycetaceae bacterium]
MKRWHWLAACMAAGSLTTTAWAQADGDGKSLFDTLDKNTDGQIESSEVPEEQRRFFERMLRVGDKNEDGKLSADEFKAASQDQTAPTGPPPGGPDRPGQGRFQPGQFFDQMDTNKDGKLTRDEIPEQAKERMGRLFDTLGKDELTREDLANAFRQMAASRPGGGDPGAFLKNLDKNGDGNLSRDELPEQLRDRLGRVFDQIGQDSIPIERLAQALGQLRTANGDRPRPDGDRPREGTLTEGAPREGDRPAMDRPRDGARGPQGPPRLPAFVRLLDTDKDGSLSQEELSKASELFAELDRNDDGKLNMFELMGPPPEGFAGRPGMRDGDRPQPEGDRPRRPDGERPPMDGERPRDGQPARDGDRPRPESPDQVFEQFDADKNGSLSREEVPPPMRENFDRIDQNEDGQIDKAELGRAFAARRDGRPGGPPRDGDRPRPDGERPRDNPGAFFDRADQDGDGKITREEAPERLRENFDRVDKNGDGAITRDEAVPNR